jgi:hypothetical protein
MAHTARIGGLLKDMTSPVIPSVARAQDPRIPAGLWAGTFTYECRRLRGAVRCAGPEVSEDPLWWSVPQGRPSMTVHPPWRR